MTHRTLGPPASITTEPEWQIIKARLGGRTVQLPLRPRGLRGTVHPAASGAGSESTAVSSAAAASSLIIGH
jgi:hypothetical protein